MSTVSNMVYEDIDIDEIRQEPKSSSISPLKIYIGLLIFIAIIGLIIINVISQIVGSQEHTVWIWIGVASLTILLILLFVDMFF